TGKGTYVRALVRDIEKTLGTVGYVSALRRTAVGPFTEDDAVTLEEVTGQATDERLDPDDRTPTLYEEHLLGLERAFGEYPQVAIERPAAVRISMGNDAILPPPQVTPLRQGCADDIEPILAVEGGRPVAICRLEGLKLRPVKVFNL
ncbi:MAG: tRNA pseudouridine(55) synthase TruB, partial [Pseudomonadota bacterium]